MPDECSIGGSPQDFCRLRHKTSGAVAVRPILLNCDISFKYGIDIRHILLPLPSSSVSDLLETCCSFSDVQIMINIFASEPLSLNSFGT